ncbi:alpha/beta hydrolase [Hymenobacter mucosus]|uniref:Lysophospholipase, alpha-beta hydrolase superfamily n=1 Tax=Hymenobacter mucosus TaxID=1411120 RepID=A0A238W4M4_9BACT|nr:alpha/beta hydrolase [Hymenobacter mucosus]SNR41351.1 Lysophospholipase, alpha-beta hydrolase superfamily [Hymenobacter mucosus]
MPSSAAYLPDPLGPDFEQLYLPQPDDYEGAVRATLVRHRQHPATTRAVLHVHGFNDYFFQHELAAEYAAHGLRFYALDLRKYGRSLLPHQRPNNVRQLSEYFSDLEAALAQLRAEGSSEVVLSGHSTGGLIVSIYAAQFQPAAVVALVLNSPFLELHQSWAMRHLAVPVVTRLGARWPNLPLPGTLPDVYGQTLHQSFRGEWNYNLAWKPNQVFSLNAGWLRAIRHGHAQVRRGLGIRQPVLVLHSARTAGGGPWREEFQEADIVLNVAHIRALAPQLGTRVTTTALPGALHDVFLSRPTVRVEAYRVLFAWLAEVLT